MSSLPLFFSFSLWLQWTDTFFKEEQYKYSLEWYFMSLETESRYFLRYFCTRVEVLISSNTCAHARCLCIELKATDNDFRENQSSKSLNITERKWMGENQMSTTKMKSNKTQAFLFIGICHHRVLVWCRAVSCCRGRRRGLSVWKIDQNQHNNHKLFVEAEIHFKCSNGPSHIWEFSRLLKIRTDDGLWGTVVLSTSSSADLSRVLFIKSNCPFFYCRLNFAEFIVD